jgi:two-component system, OmpR family, response regulator MtrA
LINVPHELLLVEDDAAVARAVARGLERAGFAVTVAGDGRHGLDAFCAGDFDLVVLDLVLPDVDGIDVCRRIRRDSLVPVLMMSGRSDTLDIVIALEVGADDYVRKPCEMAELVARVRALLRRPEARVAEERVIRAGPLEIDTGAFTVGLNGEPVSLSPTEFRLLVELARESGKAFARQDLLERVWGYDYLGDSRIVDMAIRRLREQIEVDPPNPTLIQTVRGIGYRLDVPPSGRAPSDLYTYSLRLRDACHAVAGGLDRLKSDGANSMEPLVADFGRLERLIDEFVDTQPD